MAEDEAVEIEQAPEESSMRDDFEAAMAEHDNQEDGGTEEEGHAAGEKAAEETEKEEVSATGNEGQEQQPEPAASASKAPVGWSPTDKQDWEKLPDNVKAAIGNREREISQVMEQTAGDRRTAQNYNQLVNAYAPIFAAEGVQDPIQGLQGLINITAELQQGSQLQKAQRIKGLIQHYGVDITALDNLLAGEAPDPQQNQMEQLLNQRMAPVNDLLARVQAAEKQGHQQVQQGANESIQAFGADPKNDFFENVRNEMADFLDMAGRRGQKMSLEDAYQRACALNPEISGILVQRRAQEAAGQSSGNMMNKRNAASSLSGAAQPGSNDGADDSLRQSLERAMASQQG
jgi:hypothetical protein